MSLETLRSKVEQLIEIAQSGGGSTSDGAINYPNYNYVRPSWWLPRPTIISNASINEIWVLNEVDASLNEYDGIDIADAAVVRNGYKQFWQRIEGNVLDHYLPDAIELIFNCKQTAYISAKMLTVSASIAPGVTFPKLQIVTGTPLQLKYNASAGSSFQFCPNLKLILNNISIVTSGNYIFGRSGLIKAPNIISTNLLSSAAMYGYCYNIVDGGTLSANSATNTFAHCINLQKIHLAKNCVTVSNTFIKCENLKYVTIEQDHAKSLYLSASTKYPPEVLHQIIENLADLTGATALDLIIGETNIAKIDEAHIAMLNEKNWNYS